MLAPTNECPRSGMRECWQRARLHYTAGFMRGLAVALYRTTAVPSETASATALLVDVPPRLDTGFKVGWSAQGDR